MTLTVLILALSMQGACHTWTQFSVDRALARSSGGHGFNSCRGLRFFPCPTLMSCWSVHFSQNTLNWQESTLPFSSIWKVDKEVCMNNYKVIVMILISPVAMRIVGVFLLSLSGDQLLPFLYHVLTQDIFWAAVETTCTPENMNTRILWLNIYYAFKPSGKTGQKLSLRSVAWTNERYFYYSPWRESSFIMLIQGIEWCFTQPTFLLLFHLKLGYQKCFSYTGLMLQPHTFSAS